MIKEEVISIYNLLIEKRINISDLSEMQKDKLIEFCNLQINIKKHKLNVIKKEIIKIKDELS